MRESPLDSRGVRGEEWSWLSPDEREGRPMGREGEGSSDGALFVPNTPARTEGGGAEGVRQSQTYISSSDCANK